MPAKYEIPRPGIDPPPINQREISCRNGFLTPRTRLIISNHSAAPTSAEFCSDRISAFYHHLSVKFIFAITGIILFVIAYLLGNLQIFLGRDWVNGVCATFARSGSAAVDRARGCYLSLRYCTFTSRFGGRIFAWAIFLGYTSIPAAVLFGLVKPPQQNVYRLAEASNSIIDWCVGRGVPFARE